MIKQATEPAAPTSGRRRWRAEEAREILEQWRNSGEALVRFAQTRGLDANRLYRWRKRLSKRDVMPKPAAATPTSAAFIPVGVRGATSSTLVVVLPDGVRVEISEATSATAEWVAELLRASSA